MFYLWRILLVMLKSTVKMKRERRKMKKTVSLLMSVIMLFSVFSALSVQAEELRSFNKVIYNHTENLDENKGWTSESSSGATVTSDDSGNVAIKSNGTGQRYAALDVQDTTSKRVEVEFAINAKLYNSNDNEKYSYFSFTDPSKKDILNIKVGNTAKNADYTATVNNTEISGINSAVTNYRSDISLSASAIIDFEAHTADVTIGENTYNVDIPEDVQSIGYVRASMQRDISADYKGNSAITVSALTITELNEPEIRTSADCVKNDDGTYTVTVAAEEQIAVAKLVNYDYNQDSPQYTVIQNSTLDSNCATVEFLPLYDEVVISGIAPSQNAGSFTVHIENADGSKELTFNVVVIESQMKPLPTEEQLTPVNTETPILSIDFEGEDSDLYSIMDEYGRITSDTNSWTAVEDTTSGLKFRSETKTNPENSGINSKAFYSWLTPETGTEKGNGYRGSRLVLDNEKVQRTDKIKVSYDFGFYNIINQDNGDDVGTPQCVSMTSEAVESGSIPYDFNEQHYREPDADVSDIRGISKHLLTFVTGRIKRNGEGIYGLDMTNQLGYFEPRYADDDSVGRYKKIDGITLTPNAFNFFHVDADVDFYNHLIKFTITNTQDTSQTATITTSIPEHASWNGFIVSSQKWDTSNPRNESDIDGQDTEHYIYLDNISAVKIAEDDSHINTTAPAARELPTDAIINAKNGAADTWKYGTAYNLLPDTETEGYKIYDSETDRSYGFANEIATGANAKEITSYTEFDFYLPKKGSYITLYERGMAGNSEAYGNTIIISDAGICSWETQEYYTSIYENNLECGKWYSMTIIYDHYDEKEKVVLYDGDTEIASKDVRVRNLNKSFYRAIWINRNEINSGDCPSFKPSMATTYIANLRIYNRGVLQEFYPEGSTVSENTMGEIKNADGNSANDSRLGAYVGTFVMNQVEGNDVTASDSTVKWGSIPSDVSVANGYKFTGWKLIYQNGTGADATDVTNTGDSTRLKYAATSALLSGKIQGVVWNDVNGDGIKDDNETVMKDVSVVITDKNDPTKKYELKTDENGKYTTDNIPAGEYTVTVTTPNGYNPTTDVVKDITVNDGDEKTVNAGFVGISPTVSPVVSPTTSPVVSPTTMPTTSPTVTSTPNVTPTVIPATSRPYRGGGGSSSSAKATTTPKATVTPTTAPNPTATPNQSVTDGNIPELNKTEHYAYIVGYPEGDVRPENNITREEVATIFFRLLTDKSRAEYWKQTNDYGDVADERWSNNAVSTMTNSEGVFGYEDGTFRPSNAITRAEFSAIAARFDSGEYKGENKFSDIDGHWAAEEINRAAERGWISGYEDGTFRPNQYITRAEAMTLINKILERIVEPDGIHENAIFWSDNPSDMWYYTEVEEATNSHDYERKTDNTETWTKINQPRDWEKLERAWSTAQSAGHEDSVIYGE